ncbi:FeoB-associated Cys-rich membrane protein [Peptostreptococcus faecalis]|uniref:FeoB-associated Cys-rich membrane protein n=1 Tax=Peptostreptococcus faecalis TaxID=2045015 RepID=UPI000C7D59CE|nr:FeoB-associated Cys-rich membrane protein [Peptostreptococcus faecalis]
MNLATFIVLAIVVVAAVFAAIRVRKKGGCSCGKTECPSSCRSCPTEENKPKM